MENCIFCKINNNEIPSSTIYEDEKVKVFLDLNPCTNGHMLVIPKKHYENLFTIDEDIILHSIKVIKENLYPLIKEKLNCQGLTISQNNGHGQEIKHYHIHVIPRYLDDNDIHNYNHEILLPINEVHSKLTEK